MKKHLINLFPVVVFCALLFSCKKDDNGGEQRDPDLDLPELTAATMPGYYVGHYGAGANTPNIDYAFRLMDNSALVVYDQSADTVNGKKAYGTWEYNATTKKLKTYYRYNDSDAKVYSTIGDLKHRRFIGTWGPNQETATGGTYNVRYTSN
ncbi:MAG TPA: hypothetical protein VFV68_05650 [Agriterribacter sp.]|nr:hypothetical protein [Agriterribacter sp.]